MRGQQCSGKGQTVARPGPQDARSRRFSGGIRVTSTCLGCDRHFSYTKAVGSPGRRRLFCERRCRSAHYSRKYRKVRVLPHCIDCDATIYRGQRCGLCWRKQPHSSNPNRVQRGVVLSSHLCECGCGARTYIAARTRRAGGQIRGEPLRFLPLHRAGGGSVAEWDRRKSARRREIQRGGDSISMRIVYARDGGRCWLCSRNVSRALKGPHPQSASIDHVRPLSLGGEHSYANVRLAHLICNTRRGAKVA